MEFPSNWCSLEREQQEQEIGSNLKFTHKLGLLWFSVVAKKSARSVGLFGEDFPRTDKERIEPPIIAADDEPDPTK